MEFDFGNSHFTGSIKDSFVLIGENKSQKKLTSLTLIMNQDMEYDVRIPIIYELENQNVELGFWYIGSEVFEERGVITKRSWQSINCDCMNPYKDVLESQKTQTWMSLRIQKLIDLFMNPSTIIETCMLQDILVCEEFLKIVSSRYYIQFTPQFVRQITNDESFVVGSMVLLNKSSHLLHDLSIDLIMDPIGFTIVKEYQFNEIALYTASITKTKKDSMLTLSGSVYGSAHSTPTSRNNNFERILEYISTNNSQKTRINISGDQNTYNFVSTNESFGIKNFVWELLRFGNDYEARERINQALLKDVFYNCPLDKNGIPKPTFLGIAKDSILTIKDKLFRLVFSGEILGMTINPPIGKIRYPLDANISNYKQEVQTIEYEFTDHLSIWGK